MREKGNQCRPSSRSGAALQCEVLNSTVTAAARCITSRLREETQECGDAQSRLSGARNSLDAAFCMETKIKEFSAIEEESLNFS